MNLTFTFNGESVPQSRPRFGRGGRVYEPARMTAFKSAIRAAASAAMAGSSPLSEPIACTLKFYRKFKPISRRFGDLDNLSKAILDAVNGLAFTDDAQITRLVAEKFTDKKNPRVEVSIEPADAQ